MRWRMRQWDVNMGGSNKKGGQRKLGKSEERDEYEKYVGDEKVSVIQGEQEK